MTQSTSVYYSGKTIDEIYLDYRELYKDFYGVRPADLPLKVRLDRSSIIGLIEAIQSQMQPQRSTFDGREALRAEGWIIEETDPELQKLAEQLQAKRLQAEASINAEYEATLL